MWAGCNTFDFVWTLLSGSVWTIEHLFRKHKSKMIEKFGNVGLGLNRLDTTSNIWRKTRTRTFRPGRTGLHRAIAGKNISCEFICTDQSRGKAGFMFSILTLRISTIKICSFLLPIPVRILFFCQSHILERLFQSFGLLDCFSTWNLSWYHSS